MPKFPTKQTEIRKVYLPTTKDLEPEQQLWVEIELGKILTGDIMEMNSEDTTTQARAGAHMLLSRIRDWNFEEDNGEKAAINFNNVCRMDLNDYSYLGELIKGSQPATLPKKNESSLPSTSSSAAAV